MTERLVNFDRLLAALDAGQLDAVVATSPENVLYLTNYECTTHWINKGSHVFALVTPASDRLATLIAPALELEAIPASGVWVDDIAVVGGFNRAYGSGPLDELSTAVQDIADRSRRYPSAFTALQGELAARALLGGRIGIDESGLYGPDWERAQDMLPEATIVGAAELLWRVRSVKTPAEVERLRISVTITEAAILETLRCIPDGLTDRELSRHYEVQVATKGGTSSFSFIGTGERSAYPHIPPTDEHYRAGDPIRFDLGCTYRRYNSDLARTYYLTDPPRSVMNLWNVTAHGVAEAIELLKPGVDVSDVYKAAMQPGISMGLEHFARFHCGHGIGLSIYDPPLVTEQAGNDTVYLMPDGDRSLEAGMVMNVEVGYYVQGLGGFQMEDTVLITDDGYEVLSSLPRTPVPSLC
ncbi:MAG: M24 family metallopeptidase [Acidimicrobiales bacterium]